MSGSWIKIPGIEIPFSQMNPSAHESVTDGWEHALESAHPWSSEESESMLQSNGEQAAIAKSAWQGLKNKVDARVQGVKSVFGSASPVSSELKSAPREEWKGPCLENPYEFSMDCGWPQQPGAKGVNRIASIESIETVQSRLLPTVIH